MAELKTKKTTKSVSAFIKSVDSDSKQKDAQTLLKLFKEVTGKRPALWGTSIIGFGSYHYKSTRSSQEGDWPLTGFSPRKTNVSLYIMDGFSAYKPLLKKLGKHKHSVGCLYINKLEDVDLGVLKTLISKSYKTMAKRYNA